MKASRASIIAAAVAAIAAEAGAFTMEPMTALLAPSGTGSVATFRIRNEGSERVAIKLSVATRSQAATGEEVNGSADELFVLYPSRLVVEPGAQASAKVQWRGPSSLAMERSFRLIAEEVPLDAGTGKGRSSGIKVAFRYIASLYVGDERFAPSLKAAASGAKGPQGQSGFLVEIRNEGTRHVVAVDASVEIAGVQVPISSEELGALSGANYLPGASRRTFVPRPEAEAGKAYEARVACDGEF